MKYVSIDLETTQAIGPGNPPAGPEKILQISMVVEDTNNLVPVENLPSFTCFCRPGKIVGTPYAIAMNSKILEYISGYTKETPPHPVLSRYYGQYSFSAPDGFVMRGEGWEDACLDFLKMHFPATFEEDAKSGYRVGINVAGKRFDVFDRRFLPNSIVEKLQTQAIDPGLMMLNPKEDSFIPPTNVCLQRAGIDKQTTHDAYQDAMDVISMIRAASQ